MPAHHPKTHPLVVANGRHSPGYGYALRQGQEALAFARHKQPSGLFVSGLSLGACRAFPATASMRQLGQLGKFKQTPTA